MKRQTALAVRVRAAVLTLFMCGLAIAAYVRGTSATTTPDNPSSSKEGVLCAIVDDGQGHKPVRCAAIVDASPAEVSAIVRDYEHYPQVFASKLAHLTVTSVTPEPGKTVHFTGNLVTLFKTLPIDVRISHTDEGDKYVASWDEPHGSLLKDRGSWTAQPARSGGTLLVYQLEVEAPRSPDFLVNNVLLSNMGTVVEHVRARARALKGQASP